MSAFSRSYARALLESAPSGYDVEKFLSAAGVIRNALASDARLRAFFSGPAIPQDAKRRVLEDLSGRAHVDDFGLRFLNLILTNRRLGSLSEILSATREESDRRGGMIEAQVTIAGPVAPEQERKIAERLSRLVGKAVRLRVQVDPKILAGFVATVGSKLFDASALRAVEAFSKQQKETAGA